MICLIFPRISPPKVKDLSSYVKRCSQKRLQPTNLSVHLIWQRQRIGVLWELRGVSPKNNPHSETTNSILAERGVIPLGVHFFGWMLSLLGQLLPMMSISRLRWYPLKKHLWLGLWYGSKVSSCASHWQNSAYNFHLLCGMYPGESVLQD